MRRARKYSVLLGFSLFLSSWLLFTLLELFPSLILRLPLQHIPYYALKGRYVPDPDLVFRYRNGFQFDTISYGDDYFPDFGVEPEEIPYSARYNAAGFRDPRGPEEDAEIVLLGDSFIEVGETNEKTFGQYVEKATRLKTASFGMGWYGPCQYVTLLEKYAISKKPRYAFFSFYEGNDLEDIHQYIRWKNGDSYYWVPPTQNVVVRYASVLFQFAQDARQRLTGKVFELKRRSSVEENPPVHPDVAEIRLAGKTYLCSFRNKSDVRQPQEIEESEEWKRLTMLLTQFQSICAQHNIIPIVLFLPAKVHVYAKYTTPASGDFWLQERAQQIAAAKNVEKAMVRLCEQLGLRLVSFSQLFDELAANGMLPYYRFDSHWKNEAKAAAAEMLATELSNGSPVAVSLYMP